MRTIWLTGIVVLCLCLVVSAQYAVNWYSIDGGGGMSTGGVYSLSGTIGQADAGRLQGGDYILEGGFMSAFAAVQTEGAPPLVVSLSTTNTILISWPSPSSGFILQQSSAITGSSWTAVQQTPVLKNQQWEVVVQNPGSSRFFRLRN